MVVRLLGIVVSLLKESDMSKIKVGSKVVYTGTGEREIGVVIHIHHDEKMGTDDALVAFLAQDKFPETRVSKQNVYVLRYFVSSLQLYEDE